MDLRRHLEGRSILVTGSSMGIGLECARCCLSYGAKVTICARGPEALEAAREALSSEFGASRIFKAVTEVGSAADVEALFAGVYERFERCDGVIHAAAVLGPIGPVEQTDPAEWWEAIRINLFGTYLVTRAAAQRMRPSGGGRIVLFSGGGASTPFPNYTAYASSKVAVVRFAETVAREFGPDVEVNCLAPGFVATRMQQQTIAAGGRAGKDYLEQTRAEVARGGVSPTVAAEAAAFLVSGAAKGISGKFVAAAYDGYDAWPAHLDELRETDVFTLRRVLPRDRGMDWQ